MMAMDEIYGSRARIGYTCPVYQAEIFPYDFYKMAPDGVTLVTATASVWFLLTALARRNSWMRPG